MLTTTIPQSQARKSAEDQLAEFILSSLQQKAEVCFSYFHSGCAVGKWVAEIYCVYTKNAVFHAASLQAIQTVLSEFQRSGYLVNEHVTAATWTNVRISK